MTGYEFGSSAFTSDEGWFEVWALGESRGKGPRRSWPTFVSYVKAAEYFKDAGRLARRAEFFQQRVGETATSTLRCEYWMPVPDASRLLCITISAPTVPEPDLFTQLFDSVVDSVTWTSEPIPVQIED